MISAKVQAQRKQKIRHSSERVCYEPRESHKERNNSANQHLPFLVSGLPLVFWFCWALWLFSSVLRTADSNRSFIQVVQMNQCPSTKTHPFTASYLLLLQPLSALLLHSGAPLLPSEPLLQEFLLPLLQLLFVVLPGPLLPLQPVLVPMG